MNKIDELIQRLCPDGVEYRELGELAIIETGTQLNKTKMYENGDYPVQNGGIKPSGYYNQYNTEENTITISQGGASAGYVNYIKTKFWAGAHCFVVKQTNNKINYKYIYYVLKNNQEALMKSKIGAGIPGLNRNELIYFQIPVPPIEIQEEIVKILDKFTALEAELEAELEARRKQYEYYRNELLKPKEVNGRWLMNGKEAEWKTLGEVCISISAGGDLPDNFKKGQIKPTPEYPYPIYANATDLNGLYGYTDGYKVETEAVTISARGSKVGFHTVREAKFTPIIRLITLIPNKNVLTTKFLNYILDTTLIAGDKGGIPQLTVPNVKRIVIPIPPLEEQEKIVGILDKFDALVNDISEGLPAEIEARRKQYEYYRGKLLEFEKRA